MAFGKMLEQKMIEKGIKQAELAAAIGIPKSTLSCIISRDNTKIEIELFLKICQFLDCNPETFYNEYREEEHKTLPPSFVKKYHKLDTYGRQAVDSILDIEYARCVAEEKITIRYAASSKDDEVGRTMAVSEETMKEIRKSEGVSDDDELV